VVDKPHLILMPLALALAQTRVLFPKKTCVQYCNLHFPRALLH
jgi:hypothetical protein